MSRTIAAIRKLLAQPVANNPFSAPLSQGIKPARSEVVNPISNQSLPTGKKFPIGEEPRKGPGKYYLDIQQGVWIRAVPPENQGNHTPQEYVRNVLRDDILADELENEAAFIEIAQNWQKEHGNLPTVRQYVSAIGDLEAAEDGIQPATQAPFEDENGIKREPLTDEQKQAIRKDLAPQIEQLTNRDSYEKSYDAFLHRIQDFGISPSEPLEEFDLEEDAFDIALNHWEENNKRTPHDTLQDTYTQYGLLSHASDHEEGSSEEIAKALIEDWNSSNMAQNLDDSIRSKIHTLDIVEESLQEGEDVFIIRATSNEPLSKEEIAILLDDLVSQFSDGFGEGFEQRTFPEGRSGWRRENDAWHISAHLHNPRPYNTKLDKPKVVRSNYEGSQPNPGRTAQKKSKSMDASQTNTEGSAQLKAKNILETGKGQSEVDGSLTKKVDNDMENIVLADRDTVGSPYSPLYWAMEIAKTIRNFPAGDPNVAYENILRRAKETGLSTSQENAIKKLLLSFHIPVDVKVAADADTRASDSYLSFPQRQVAAQLKIRKARLDGGSRLLRMAQEYHTNKIQILDRMASAAISRKIQGQLDNGFTREEVASDVQKWSFSDSLKKRATAALLPKKVILANRLVLSNAPAKRENPNYLEAIVDHARHASLSPNQQLRLASLKSRFDLETPWWIHRVAQKTVNAPGLSQKDYEGIAAKIGQTHDLVTDNSFGKIFEPKSKAYQIHLRPSTTSFTSKTNPDYEYTFGTNSDEIDKYLQAADRMPWATKPKMEIPKATDSIDEPPPEQALEAKPKGPSARSIMLPMLAQGIDEDQIIAALTPLFGHRDEKGLRAQIKLNKKWLFSPAQTEKLKVLKEMSGNPDIRVAAKLTDGRVLIAFITASGECSFNTRFHPELKQANRRMASKDEGWVEFIANRFSARPKELEDDPDDDSTKPEGRADMRKAQPENPWTQKADINFLRRHARETGWDLSEDHAQAALEKFRQSGKSLPAAYKEFVESGSNYGEFGASIRRRQAQPEENLQEKENLKKSTGNTEEAPTNSATIVV